MGEMRGREIDLDVTNMAHGGSAVARFDGRVVFVADAIPGEKVRARLVDDERPRFWRAVTTEVLEPSPDRRSHVWPEADLARDPAVRPGGADYGHIALDRQRQLKAGVLADALQRMAGVTREVSVEALPGEDDGTGWRTRERLHIGQDGRVGPYAARSHRVVEVADLPLATPVVRDVAPLRERMHGPGPVTVLSSSAGEGARVVVGEQQPRVIRELVGAREFEVDDTGFWQVHVAAPAVLSAAVQDAIEVDRFDPAAANLDLYGGVGLLAAAIGDRFGPTTRISSVESDARASGHARANLAEWVQARAVTDRVERYVGGLGGLDPVEAGRLADATVVLDPPRSGAGEAVLAPLAAVGPSQLVYVACDPVAFARDVAILAGLGYALDRLRAFDLFPNTHHLEVVATFRRA